MPAVFVEDAAGEGGGSGDNTHGDVDDNAAGEGVGDGASDGHGGGAVAADERRRDDEAPPRGRRVAPSCAPSCARRLASPSRACVTHSSSCVTEASSRVVATTRRDSTARRHACVARSERVARPRGRRRPIVRHTPCHVAAPARACKVDIPWLGKLGYGDMRHRRPPHEPAYARRHGARRHRAAIRAASSHADRRLRRQQHGDSDADRPLRKPPSGNRGACRDGAAARL